MPAFRVCLGLEQTAMAQTAPTILLVDDDVDFLELTRQILLAQGFKVECATDPGQALRVVTAAPPALVITDLMMTTLDAGVSLAAQIKATPGCQETPIILMTAAASARGFNLTPRTQADLTAMQIDAFFAKPAPVKDLLAKITELLARRRGKDA